MSLLGLGSLCSRQTLKLGRGYQFQQLISAPRKWVTTTSNLKAVEPLDSKEDFWVKNKRLNRPISPHLTIYQPQVTWILSITHRATGLAMSGLLSGLAIGMLAVPNNFPTYINLLCASNYGAAAIFTAKFLIAFPFVFHLANGIRHLVWDMGKGFQLKELYASGYTVLGISLLLSVLLASK